MRARARQRAHGLHASAWLERRRDIALESVGAGHVAVKTQAELAPTSAAAPENPRRAGAELRAAPENLCMLVFRLVLDLDRLHDISSMSSGVPDSENFRGCARGDEPAHAVGPARNDEHGSRQLENAGLVAASKESLMCTLWPGGGPRRGRGRAEAASGDRAKARGAKGEAESRPGSCAEEAEPRRGCKNRARPRGLAGVDGRRRNARRGCRDSWGEADADPRTRSTRGGEAEARGRRGGAAADDHADRTAAPSNDEHMDSPHASGPSQAMVSTEPIGPPNKGRSRRSAWIGRNPSDRRKLCGRRSP